MNKKIIEFYENNKCDVFGKTLDDILKSDFDTLAKFNTHIMYLFPLKYRNTKNPFEPIIDEETIEYFKHSKKCQHNIKRAFFRMLGFYGLKYNLKEQSCEVVNCNRYKYWMKPDYNYGIITRILDSLELLGLDEMSNDFSCFLEALWQDYHDVIPYEYFREWSKLYRITPPGVHVNYITAPRIRAMANYNKTKNNKLDNK